MRLTTIIMITLSLMAASVAWAQAQIKSLTISTNQTGDSFTASSGGTAVYAGPTYCQTATLTFTAPVGDYYVQWKSAQFGFLDVYPPISIHNDKPKSVTLAIPTNSAALFRLRKIQ